MITGGCLCGGVRFEFDEPEGDFDLCHCSRCRKASGSAFLAGMWVEKDRFRMVQGDELVRSYAAPILHKPPAYRSCFCSRCGSPVPRSDPDFFLVDVPAGSLDDDPGIRPDKHLVIGPKAPWFEITDELPRMDVEQLKEYRLALWFRRRSR